MRTIHGGVVFKALLADVLHEGPEPRNRHDRFGREGIKRIVGENTITYVGADGPRQIIRADTGIGEWPLGRSSRECADGILFTEHRSQNRRGTDAMSGRNPAGPESGATIRDRSLECTSDFEDDRTFRWRFARQQDRQSIIGLLPTQLPAVT